MQTKNFLFVIGLAATLLAPARTCVARDTPEQIKAREALRQKMAELDAAATPPKPAAPEPPPAVPPQPAAPVDAPQKKAPVAPVVPAPVPAPAPVAAVTYSGDPKFGPVPEAVENANTIQLREALRREMAGLQPSPTVAKRPVKSGRAAAYTASAIPAPPLMEVPLSPLAGAKAERLAELLQRYKADQISPKDYHTQRAAILAEP